MTKLKTYVLTLSKKFPGHHPRKGDFTKFKKKYLDGQKIHTIRANYDFWKKRIDKINAGEAVLSIRQWSGRPYASRQVTIGKLTKVGYQPVRIKKHDDISTIKMTIISTDNRAIAFRELDSMVKNDGFDKLNDLHDWFKTSVRNGIIIHFTDFRY